MIIYIKFHMLPRFYFRSLSKRIASHSSGSDPSCGGGGGGAAAATAGRKYRVHCGGTGGFDADGKRVKRVGGQRGMQKTTRRFVQVIHCTCSPKRPHHQLADFRCVALMAHRSL